MTEANLQTVWSTLLVASLADAGVTDIVISPGSRSTPFVVAAVREPRLRRHTVIDERAAAFFALGQARVTGRPSVLLCTSGTALAHYLPAVIEANATGTPMILLTADRPHELYDCRAPQTIDQVKIFGDNARLFFDLVQHDSDAALRGLRRVVAQAVLGAAWPRAGAVQLNARARKPLEPVTARSPAEVRLEERARAVLATPLTFARPPRATPAPESVRDAVETIARAERGVIIAGPARMAQASARAAVFALARATGFPLAPEATSQLRFAVRPPDVTCLDGFELLLRSPSFIARRGPDVAIEIGDPPTSGPWGRLAPAVSRVVLADAGWPDPHGNARAIVFGDVASTCDALVAALGAGARTPEVPPAWADANALAWRTVEAELDACPTLVEAAAVRALVDALPEGSTLMLGNSLAVRLVDIYAPAAPRNVSVLAQRGASGIDGLVAAAAGASSAGAGPLVLLLGDVSLVYDVASLALAARATRPLVVFVLNNAGGRIFEQLPLASTEGLEPEILEHATTPQQLDFSRAADLFGARYARASSASEVSGALREALAHVGCTLVDVHVEPSGAALLGARVAAAMEAALAGREASGAR